MHLRPERVVAFSKNGLPVKTNFNWALRISYWKATLHARRSFSFRSLRVFDLTSEVQFFGETDRVTTQARHEISVGRTLGRMYLTGLAADKMKPGKFSGAALMDLSLRGVARNKTSSHTTFEGVIVFKDTSVVRIVNANESEWERLKSLLAKSVLGSRGQEAAGRDLDEVRRLCEDGERVLPELSDKIEKLSLQMSAALEEAQRGDNFERRAASRRLFEDLERKYSHIVMLFDVVCWEFGLPMGGRPGTASAPEKTAPEPVPAMPANHPSSEAPEDHHWAQTLAELESGGRQAGLWARCFAEAQGNESLARANYLTARARQLADQHRAQILKTQQAEEQAKRDAETARLAAEQRRYDLLPKGHCPSCNEVILLSAQECLKCRAVFTPGSAWKVLPIKGA